MREKASRTNPLKASFLTVRSRTHTRRDNVPIKLLPRYSKFSPEQGASCEFRWHGFIRGFRQSRPPVFHKTASPQYPAQSWQTMATLVLWLSRRSYVGRRIILLQRGKNKRQENCGNSKNRKPNWIQIYIWIPCQTILAKIQRYFVASFFLTSRLSRPILPNFRRIVSLQRKREKFEEINACVIIYKKKRLRKA